MSQIQTTAKDVAGNPVISNATFQRIMGKYKPAMMAMYRNEPEKIKALNMMKRAYEIATRNTRSPIGGGSDTAENVLTELGKINLLSRSASVVKGLLKAVSKYGRNQVDDLVTRALFDPDYAETLIAAAQGKIRPEQIQTVINGKVMRLEALKQRRLAAVMAGGAAAIDD